MKSYFWGTGCDDHSFIALIQKSLFITLFPQNGNEIRFFQDESAYSIKVQ